jgi:CBS domain-containing protein
MQVREIMTEGFRMIGQDESIRHAAELMRDLDVGILPVLEENQLVGTLTDRDITVRATAAGISPDDTSVSEIMSRGVLFAYEDDDVRSAAATMEKKQVRRLLVLDHDERCVGILSLGDLAVRAANDSLSGQVIQEASKTKASEPR